MSGQSVLYGDVREGDTLAVVGTVVVMNAGGLGLKIGDDVTVPIQHRALRDHAPTIRIGDKVREAGVDHQGGPRVGVVTQFLDADGEPLVTRYTGDTAWSKGRAFIVVMPDGNAIGTREPKVYRPHQLERFPLSQLKAK